jgi:hypothetical protein
MIVPATRSDWRGWHNFKAFSKLPGEEKFWTLAASGARRHFQKKQEAGIAKALSSLRSASVVQKQKAPDDFVRGLARKIIFSQTRDRRCTARS